MDMEQISNLTHHVWFIRSLTYISYKFNVRIVLLSNNFYLHVLLWQGDNECQSMMPNERDFQGLSSSVAVAKLAEAISEFMTRHNSLQYNRWVLIRGWLVDLAKHRHIGSILCPTYLLMHVAVIIGMIAAIWRLDWRNYIPLKDFISSAIERRKIIFWIDSFQCYLRNA